jgi:hypothetical protein
MAIVDKSALLAERFGIEEVEIPGVGSVRVRPLSRAEAHAVRGQEMTEEEVEVRLLSVALVEPKLTEDEVKAWQANSPAGELEPVVRAVVRISGMEQHAAKAAFPEARG